MRKDLYLSTKGHGYIKKTKAYGAVGAIALTGVISIAGNTSVVLAEESDIPLSDPAVSNDSSASDVIQAEVISSDLNQSIDEANTEGVILTEQDPVTYQSLEEAQTDLEQQTVEVQKAVEEKKNNNDNVEEIEAKNAEIKKRNEEGQAAVDKYNQEGQAAVDARNAAGQAEVDQRNKEGQEAVDKRNAEGQAAVDARNAAGQAEVDARNEAGQAAVDQRNAEGQAAVDARNAEGQAAVDEENARRKAEYDAKMEAYNQALADLEEKMRQYNEGLATYEEVGEALAQLEETGATTFGLQPSGAWTNLKPVEVTEGVKVYGKGSVGSIQDILAGNYQMVVYSDGETIPEDHIVKSIIWGDIMPEYVDYTARGVIPFDQIQAQYEDMYGLHNDLYNTDETGTTITCSVVEGQWVRFKDAVTMADGSKRDLEVKFDKVGERLPLGWEFVTLWNANGSINCYEGSERSPIGHDDGVRREYRISGASEDEKFLWSSIVYDTDAGQYLYGNYNVLSVGGAQGFDGEKVYSLEDASAGTVINPKYPGGVDMSGTDSAPDGTSALVTYNNTYIITTQNTPGGLGYLTAVGDFGYASVSPTVVTPPVYPDITPPEEPTVEYLSFTPETFTPETFTPEEFTPETFTPETFTPETFVPETFTPREFTPEPYLTPETIQVTANYHKVFVEQTPGNQKSVQDSTGTDINENTVAKNSEAHWVLGNAPLRAGRDFIKELSLSDVLPDDFDIDLTKTASESADYNVSYDSATRTVIFAAKEAAIESLNADMRNYVEIPLAIIVGYPTKDSASYPNTFTTHLTTIDATYDTDPSKKPEKGEKEQKIDIPSNEVIIYTPGEVTPKKQDLNEDGIDINGKVVNIGETNVYNLLWNLEPYKNMQADAGTIAKGFYYFDDFPEEAVTINTNDVKVIDADGNEIGIEVSEYASIDELPQEIKAIVDANKLSFKGALQVIKVTDPTSFFENYVKAGKNLTVINPMTVKEEMKNSGKKYTNNAFQIDFGNAYATNEVENEVPVVDPVKQDLNASGEDIDGKVVTAGSTNYYKLKWDLDQYKGMEASKDTIQSGFFYLDDFDENAVTPLNDQVSFLDEAGNAVSGIVSAVYDAVSAAPQAIQDAITKNGFDIKGALQVFTVEDPVDFYNKYVKTGINVYITTPMQVKVDTLGKYFNGGFQIDFGNIGYQTNIVENEVVKPEPVKEDLNAKGEDINEQLVSPGSINYYKLKWDLDQYKDIVPGVDEIQKGFFYLDDYDEKAVTPLNDEVSFIDEAGNAVSGIVSTVYDAVSAAPQAIQDAIAKNGFDIKGALQVFTASDPMSFYSNYVKKGINVYITTPMKVKAETIGKYLNGGFQIDFGNVGYQTNIVENRVEVPEPVKKDLNNDGVDINGKKVTAGSTNVYELTWDLDQYKGIKADDETIAKGFMFVDDYPEEALNASIDSITIVDSDGNAVSGISAAIVEGMDTLEAAFAEPLKAAGINPKGSFILFKADNAKDFFEKYVTTGKNLTITAPMTVKAEMAQSGGKYQNTAYQFGFGTAVQTETVENEVPVLKPIKSDLNTNGIDINGKVVNIGETNVYKMLWNLAPYKDMEADASTIAKGFYYFDDYPEEAVTINTNDVIVIDTNGNRIDVTVTSYNSVNEADAEIKDLVIQNQLKIKGAFQVIKVNDPKYFFENYVKKGIDLTVIDPMTVKDKMKNSRMKYTNNAFQVDFGNAYATNTVSNGVPVVEPVKEDLDAKGTDIHTHVVAPGSINYYKLKWDLDQYKDMAASTDSIKKGFFYIDDFDENAVTPLNDKVSFIDEAGNAVSGIVSAVYDAVTAAPQAIQDAITKNGFDIKGALQVFTASDPMSFYSNYVSKGINVYITTPMQVKTDMVGKYENGGFQIDFGNIGYQTNIVENEVVQPEPVKQDFNEDGVDIDGNLVNAGSVNVYKMNWDLDQYKGINADDDIIAKGFYFFDDYPEEAVTINTSDVKVIDADGNEIGIEVSEYTSIDELPQEIKSIVDANKLSFKGALQVIKVTDPTSFFESYVKAGKNLTVINPMTVKKELKNSGAKYTNNAFQVDFGMAYATNEVINEIPVVDPVKEDLNAKGEDIHTQTVAPGSINYYKLKWDLDQYKGIEVSKDTILKGFSYVDYFDIQAVTPLEDKVTYVDENGNPVTGIRSEVTAKSALVPDGNGGFTSNGPVAMQTFIVEDPMSFFENYVKKGINIYITTPMQVHLNKVGKYINYAHQIDFGDMLYETNIVENNVEKPEPVKKDLNKEGIDINGKKVAAGSTNVYELTWDLDQYAGITADDEVIGKGFMFVDDYPEEALDASIDSISIIDADGKAVSGVSIAIVDGMPDLDASVADALMASGITPKGAFILFKADDAQDFFNKYVKTGKNLTITAPMTVKAEMAKTGGQYENTAYQFGFGTSQQTETVINEVPVLEPNKKDFNTEGIDIDGKIMAVGDTNVYKMLWNLAPYKDMEADGDTIAKGFYYFDDFPEEAVTINTGDVKVIDADGNEIGIEVSEYSSISELPAEIKAIVEANGLSFKGALQVIKVTDPTSFYNNYVKKGIDLTVVNPMTVRDEMKNSGAKYTNNAFQVDFGNAYATNEVENEVPKVDPVKEDLNAKGADINTKIVAPGSVNYYKLKWDLDQYKGMETGMDTIQKGFFYLDDYDENAVTPLNDKVSFIDEAGNAVSGIVSAVYDAVTATPQAIQDAIAKNGFDIKGALQVFTAVDPVDFYNKYVKTGINVYITTPMQVKAETVGIYKNGGFQIDFGNVGYQTNIVENEVVTPDPKKVDLNEKGVDINGKMVLPGSVNVYELTWDLDQYKDIEADDEVIAKGFMFVDDYPEEALDLLTDAFKLVDSDGKNVSGVSVTAFKDIKDMNQTLADALTKAGVTTKGAFVLFNAEDPTSFFNTYVKAGKNIIITAPMKVKEEMGKKGGEYENTAFQIDFGNGKQADIVVNNVPKLEVTKDVVIDVNGNESLNNSTIQKGTVFNYKLTGALVPKDRSEELWDYSFIDDYQETHDEYNGVYKVFAKVDIKTNDGKTIKAGTDVTEFTKQEIDAAKGAVTIKFDEKFLRSVGLDSEFQAEAFLQMKRIAAGDVENSFINTVNGVEVVSNVVVTHTPEDRVPGKPPVLTGVEAGASIWASMSAALGLAGTVLFRKKRK